MAENFTYKIEDVSKRPSPFSRALRGVKTFALRNARGFVELALAFIFSVSWNDEYNVSPLSCAAVGACAVYGSSPLFAFAGAVAGTLLTGRLATLSALALYVGVMMLITLIRGELRASDKLLLLVGVQIALLPFFFFKSVLSCTVGLGSLLLSVALAAVLARGEHAFITLEAGKRLNSVNLISLTVSLATLILALAGIRFYVSPAVILALTLSLAAASARRLSGVGAAALFALACAVKGGNPAYTVLITASAATAAAFCGGGRWAVAGGTAVVWGALSYIFALPSQALLEASAAIMLFVLIPRRYIIRLRRERDITMASRAQAALDKTRDRLIAASDVVDIDLNSGTAEFIKHGAPPSYILRDGKLYTIYSEALPMGILSSAPPSVHTLRLERGDSVIMTTDGVTDALGDSLIASITELVSVSNTADDAAAALLAAAADKSEDDDMTVIVLRLI